MRFSDPEFDTQLEAALQEFDETKRMELLEQATTTKYTPEGGTIRLRLAPDGSDWTAVYYMELQDDGTWRVDGVNLRKGAAGLT